MGRMDLGHFKQWAFMFSVALAFTPNDGRLLKSYEEFFFCVSVMLFKVSEYCKILQFHCFTPKALLLHYFCITLFILFFLNSIVNF